ncbi:peptidoglycan DD-metalloendopeptidase family protein [uncultured Thiodictyon sp.]|uniref:peptidoglycan DD-metalloendopeptidase family protein n=1 Tax=uncultured Thiodictyon sp. TaxID=1846217 RepID=UPI0025DA463B|nr:peptidoglycan DD-metalloendopeptidase family protein [uncultured Thiodictyon sp.]
MRWLHRPRHPARQCVVALHWRNAGAPGRWWPVALLRIGILAGLLILGGCAGTSSGPAPVVGWEGARAAPPVQRQIPKGYYRVREGDSLGTIAERRHVSVQQLIAWNHLKPPYALYRGKLLRVVAPRVPPARSTPGAAVDAPARAADRKVEVARESAPTPSRRAGAAAVDWAWPLVGVVKQGFLAGDPARQGLRISCRPGEAVRSAAAGQVAYSGSGLKGYGNLIIVKHNKDYLSAYGFNRRLLVKEGDGVTRGQVLAECGQGPDGTALLHFEVRRDGAAVNPLLYLPPRE